LGLEHASPKTVGGILQIRAVFNGIVAVFGTFLAIMIG
jgi:hypothetical protein